MTFGKRERAQALNKRRLTRGTPWIDRRSIHGALGINEAGAGLARHEEME